MASPSGASTTPTTRVDDPHRGALMPAAGSTTSAAPAQSVQSAPSGITVTTPVTQPVPAVDPSKDARALVSQGADRPGIDGTIGARPTDVFSDDWWSHTRPIVELHGYFRTRGELFHNFALGRHNAPGETANLWGQPLDNSYVDTGNTLHNIQLCGSPGSGGPGLLSSCVDKSQASANVRFRVSPEIHISDNLRIISQIDALDNLVLGSTPDAYTIHPGTTQTNPYGYVSSGARGSAPIGFSSTTQQPPTAGVNGYRNSIDVKRVWAEYVTPVGQLRFGRMPAHWGLGMVQNSGDTIDSDYQTTTDRIMFVTGLKSIDLYAGGAWEFVSTGPTNASPFDVNGGQPYNTANNANVGQWSVFFARRMNPDLQRLSLSRGDVVVNGGLYATYRTQQIDVAAGGSRTPETPLTGIDEASANNRGFERRGAWALTPDPWVQILWKKFRIEAEFAAIWGSIEQTPQNTNLDAPVKIRQFGVTAQTEYKAIEDKLRLQFGFGWASGDPWADSLNPSGFSVEKNNGRGPISTFKFNQDYRVDLIFFRHILSRVEGAYYFRPSVEYDFLRNPNGQKFGGSAAIIWSRASEFEQAPGRKRDLGVELNLSLYYQAKDGSLNDDPDKLGGFYSMLQYGVFFPLGGLAYTSGTQNAQAIDGGWDLSAAQTVRLFLGVAY